MKQNINLYQADFHPPKHNLDGKAVVMWSAVALCAAVTLVGYRGTVWYHKQRALQDLAVSAAQAERAVTDLQGSASKKTTDSHLADEVRRLEGIANAQADIAALLKNQPDWARENGGYTRHFTALARGKVEGLWLTEVLITTSGHGVMLKGKALQPELLPRYLQQLAAETPFQGLEFQVFQMERKSDKTSGESAADIEFTVATAQPDKLASH